MVASLSGEGGCSHLSGYRSRAAHLRLDRWSAHRTPGNASARPVREREVRANCMASRPPAGMEQCHRRPYSKLACCASKQYRALRSGCDESSFETCIESCVDSTGAGTGHLFSQGSLEIECVCGGVAQCFC